MIVGVNTLRIAYDLGRVGGLTTNHTKKSDEILLRFFRLFRVFRGQNADPACDSNPRRVFFASLRLRVSAFSSFKL